MPVTCPHCAAHFPKSDSVNARHKAVCEGWKSQIGEKEVLACLCGHTATSLTQMKRHRQGCETWKARDRGEVQMKRLATTLQKNHGEGATNPRRIAEAEEKRKATLQEKYGAENVFAKGSTLYEKVREASEANARPLYGSENAFSKPEVKAKIRETIQAKYGVDNPNQSPVVRARTRATNLERYGTEETLSAPVVREKIAATNVERYGGVAPSFSPEVVEKARQTNLERWGVEWTAQHPEIRRRQLETMTANYGGYFLASEEGKATVRAVLVERYGVEFPSQIDGFWNKAVATFVRKYGATHPLLLADFLDKRRDTCQTKYGVDSPLQSPDVYARLMATVLERYGNSCYFGSDVYKQRNIEKYGFPHPMMNQEYALAHLEKMGRPGPNLLEKRFGKHNPELIYTGDGSFWRWLPLVSHHKNPDFILPGPDPKHPKKGVTKAIEVFGDFWHSRVFTGKSNFEHEADLVAAYAEIGISCLIVWEGEFKADPDAVRARVLEHLLMRS